METIDDYPEYYPATILAEQDTNDSYIHNLTVLAPTLWLECWVKYDGAFLGLTFFKSWRWN